jgi:hypothetical protein
MKRDSETPERLDMVWMSLRAVLEHLPPEAKLHIQIRNVSRRFEPGIQLACPSKDSGQIT